MWKLSFSILVILGLNATMPLSSCVLRALGIPRLADFSYIENRFPGPQNGTLWASAEIASTRHGADAFSCLLHYYNTLLLPHNTCFKETVLHMASRRRHLLFRLASRHESKCPTLCSGSHAKMLWGPAYTAHLQRCTPAQEPDASSICLKA